jgi:hypothetical protein
MNHPTTTPTVETSAPVSGRPLTAGQADHLVALVAALDAAARERGRVQATGGLTKHERETFHQAWVEALAEAFAGIRDLERPAGAAAGTGADAALHWEQTRQDDDDPETADDDRRLTLGQAARLMALAYRALGSATEAGAAEGRYGPCSARGDAARARAGAASEALMDALHAMTGGGVPDAALVGALHALTGDGGAA